MLRQTGRKRKAGVLYFFAFPAGKKFLRRPPGALRTDMSDHTDEFVIKGVTLDGKPFRPSDWAERLCGVMSAFGGDHRMEYSPHVQPVTSAGVKCVVVNIRLREIEPMAYSFLLNFAKDNELEVRPGRGVKRPEEGEGAAAGK